MKEKRRKQSSQANQFSTTPENDFEADKSRLESNLSQDVTSVENLPEDAAYWTGEKVGEVEAIPGRIENKFDDAVQDVEDIPDDVERKWDDGVQDVEDAPEDVAGWVGEKVGDVERFDDRVDGAYDAGRDEERYDDDDGGNW